MKKEISEISILDILETSAVSNNFRISKKEIQNAIEQIEDAISKKNKGIIVTVPYKKVTPRYIRTLQLAERERLSSQPYYIIMAGTNCQYGGQCKIAPDLIFRNSENGDCAECVNCHKMYRLQ